MTTTSALLRSLDSRERRLAEPHWLERAAAGVLTVPSELLTSIELSALDRRRDMIQRLRAVRAGRRAAP